MSTPGFGNHESVRRWLESRAGLWGIRSINDDLLEWLERFCREVDKEPDALIDECLRPATDSDSLVLRTRARRRYIDAIERFEQETASRAAANVVRSFFIHNGVAMNPTVLR